MNVLAIVLCIVVVFLALMQFLPGLYFARLLFQRKPPVLADVDCPKTAVLLAVRGNDPFLAACVEALVLQDYPCFDIRIVVDHPDDPAWAVIQNVVARMQPANVSIEVLQHRLGTCTLKANSLLQAVAGLDESYEVIAVLDSDTVTHPTWLKELVAPLSDVRIGVASGNRWYMPERPSMGALVRYIWNAAAVVQMYYNRFTWGGTVAIRGSVVRNSQLQERWRHAVASDTAIYGVVRASGLQAAFVPSLMIINRESCSLGEFYEWMRRQLMVGRLQHGGWRMVFCYGMITSIVLAASAITLVASLAIGNRYAALWTGFGLLAYTLAMVTLLVVIEAGVRKTAIERGQATKWLSVTTLAKFAVALPLTQVLYSVALPTIRFMRDVNWRGVRYRIEGPWKIQLVKYQPYVALKRTSESRVSL